MSTTIVISPEFARYEGFIKNLPYTFNGIGETIFTGRNTIKVIEHNGLKMNVKAFKVPNFINKLIYGNIRLSKARRSYEYANILNQKGINTPAPIGYIEEKTGIFFSHSFYISVHEEFDGLMREFKWGQLKGREELLKQFALFTADMHEKRVLHLDYSPGNILYKKEGDDFSFYLVDLNRMYFDEVSMEKGCENFRRLWGSKEMIGFIAAEYAKARHFDENQCIDLTLRYHKSFWERFSKRHEGKIPYEGSID